MEYKNLFSFEFHKPEIVGLLQGLSNNKLNNATKDNIKRTLLYMKLKLLEESNNQIDPSEKLEPRFFIFVAEEQQEKYNYLHSLYLYVNRPYSDLAYVTILNNIITSRLCKKLTSSSIMEPALSETYEPYFPSADMAIHIPHCKTYNLPIPENTFKHPIKQKRSNLIDITDTKPKAVIFVMGLGEELPTQIIEYKKINCVSHLYGYKKQSAIGELKCVIRNTKTIGKNNCSMDGTYGRFKELSEIIQKYIEDNREVYVIGKSYGSVIVYGALLRLKATAYSKLHRIKKVVALTPPRYLPDTLLPQKCINIYHEKDPYYQTYTSGFLGKIANKLFNFKVPKFDNKTLGETDPERFIKTGNSVLIKDNNAYDFLAAHYVCAANWSTIKCDKVDNFISLSNIINQKKTTWHYHISPCMMYPCFTYNSINTLYIIEDEITHTYRDHEKYKKTDDTFIVESDLSIMGFPYVDVKRKF